MQSVNPDVSALLKVLKVNKISNNFLTETILQRSRNVIPPINVLHERFIKTFTAIDVLNGPIIFRMQRHTLTVTLQFCVL